MRINQRTFEQAAEQASLSPEQRERMWIELVHSARGQPQLSGATVAYYFGALIVISAMGWLMTRGWEAFGGWGISTISGIYAVCFCLAGSHLWFHKDLRIPGGLLFTMAVCMTPLFIYGIEKATGLWVDGGVSAYRDYHIWVKGSWIAMELGTIFAAAVALKWIRFPFLTAPIAFTLWYMSMDLTPLFFGKPDYTWDQRKIVSVVFGLGVLIASFVVDRMFKEDFAFWLYLFGMLAFWFGLSLMDSHSELNKALYCLVNVSLIAAGTVLRRRVFVVFGALGVFGYLGYLSYSVFKDSMLFPIVLTLLGLGVIYAGIVFQKHREELEAQVAELLPAALRNLLPPRRD